ncbi:hypothetical protein HaLaN_09337, partial [Haematococcus lacustris]
MMLEGGRGVRAGSRQGKLSNKEPGQQQMMCCCATWQPHHAKAFGGRCFMCWLVYGGLYCLGGLWPRLSTVAQQQMQCMMRR